MYSAKGRTSAWVGNQMPKFFDVIINENERKGLNWIYEQEDLLASKAAQAIASKLNRPPPNVEFKIKGYVNGIAIPFNSGVIDELDALKEEGLDANSSGVGESKTSVSE
jgi:hypothetical protein